MEKVIIKTFHADPASFAVTVEDGMVTLQATAQTAAIGHKIATQLRHIEGVVAVHELG